MNILVAINRNYISKLEVLLQSIFSNNDVITNVYLLHSELAGEDIVRLQKFCKKNTDDTGVKRVINAICVDEGVFSKVVIDIPGLSIETYYRLLAAELLPKSLDRILYLDADIVVDGPLNEYYDEDFQGCAAAVCADTIANFKDDIRTRIGLSKEGTYFNAGVILLNMPVWRELITRDKVIEILTSGRKFPFHDQDILNILLDGRLLYVNSFIYNFEIGLVRDYPDYYKNIVRPLKLRPVVYHYAGDQRSKPWNGAFNCGDFNKYYWKYAGMLVNQTDGIFEEGERLKALKGELVHKEGRIEKFRRYFNLTNRWLWLEHHGFGIDHYFRMKGFFHIVIYGMGELGTRLTEALAGSGICIDYAIDQKDPNHGNIPIKHLSDPDLPEADAVVVTPVMDYESISGELTKRYVCPVVSIEDLIYSLDTGSRNLTDRGKTVSVIVPLYNGAAYLGDIIGMLERNHDYDRNLKIELIIVNDKPGDEVDPLQLNSEVLDIELINHTENMGVHTSRVDGLQRASGEYIVFLDQDDEIDDNYLHSQLEHIGAVDAVVCNGHTADREYSGPIYPHFGRIDVCMDEWFALVCDNRIISPGQVMIRKAAIPKCWKMHLLKENGVDDYLLWLSMFERNAKFGINDNQIFTHTFTGANLSNDYGNMREAMEELILVVSRTTDVFSSVALRDFFCKVYAYHIMEVKWKWNLWDEDLIGYEEVHKLVTDMRKKMY